MAMTMKAVTHKQDVKFDPSAGNGEVLARPERPGAISSVHILFHRKVTLLPLIYWSARPSTARGLAEGVPDSTATAL
jgi:hypothetical protein